MEKLNNLKQEENKQGLRVAKIEQYTQQINGYIEEQTRAAAFRSRAKYIKDYEKNTKFFFSLEKSNFGKKTISKIQLENGETITDPQEILTAQREFYEKLYKKILRPVLP